MGSSQNLTQQATLRLHPEKVKADPPILSGDKSQKRSGYVEPWSHNHVVSARQLAAQWNAKTSPDPCRTYVEFELWLTNQVRVGPFASRKPNSFKESLCTFPEETISTITRSKRWFWTTTCSSQQILLELPLQVQYSDLSPIITIEAGLHDRALPVGEEGSRAPFGELAET